jgi:hypothetical protein
MNNKFSNINNHEDNEIEEDIKYDPKCDEIEATEEQEDFIESISIYNLI